MRLELAVEMRRLKLVEHELEHLQHQAADLSEALIVDTRDEVPTATLREFVKALETEVRSAIKEWDERTQRIADLVGHQEPGGESASARAEARGPAVFSVRERTPAQPTHFVKHGPRASGYWLLEIPMNIEVRYDLDPSVTRLRAYYLWEAAGRPLGRAEEFWHAAEAEINSEQQLREADVSAKKRARNTPSGISWQTIVAPWRFLASVMWDALTPRAWRERTS